MTKKHANNTCGTTCRLSYDAFKNQQKPTIVLHHRPSRNKESIAIQAQEIREEIDAMEQRANLGYAEKYRLGQLKTVYWHLNNQLLK